MNRNEQNGAVIRLRPQDAKEAWIQPEVTEGMIWVENGTLSAPELDGDVTAAHTKGLKYQSDEDYLNAIVVRGGDYEVSDVELSLSGYGCSDFTCKGTGILADMGSHVTVSDTKIVTEGVTRAATIATRGSTLVIRDSVLDSRGGPFPPGYVPVIGPGMMEPPAPLGLGGNCRTHLSMDNSETFLYNCKVYAAGWAALSTDASGGYVYLEANDTEVNVSGNGYCVYSDNGCHARLNRCDLKTGNMAVIQDGNSSVVLEDTKAVCGQVGFMLHGGMPEKKDCGIIRVSGSEITSQLEMFRCKSTNVDVCVKNSTLRAENGVLIRTMTSDDEFYHKTRSHSPSDYGVQFTLEDMTAEGDVLREDPERKLRLSLDKASLKGGLLGGVDLWLYDGAWTATKNSLVVLHSNDLAGIDAETGVIITAYAGEGCTLDAVYTLPSGGVLTMAEVN